MKIIDVNGTDIREILVDISGRTICSVVKVFTGINANPDKYELYFTNEVTITKEEAMELGRRLIAFTKTGSLKIEDE